MSNQLKHLLEHWYPQRDTYQWVLATIIETQGSAYRKSGAMMLINSLGKSYGLLSGGCLESDLMRQAQKCWINNENNVICYDMQDEDDIAWQLGIGCGGMVRVLLQPIDANNNYLDLINLLTSFNPSFNKNSSKYFQKSPQSKQTYFYQIKITGKQPINKVHSQAPTFNTDYFTCQVKAPPTIAIFGGGIDTIPLVAMAKLMGWYVILLDTRTNYARSAYFKQADKIINQPYKTLTDCRYLSDADVIVIMHHNIDLDAEALVLADQSNAIYIGLLGPSHRTDRVFSKANLKRDTLSKPLANPVGLDLGGELPEAIALSIMSQAHQWLEMPNKNNYQFTS